MVAADDLPQAVGETDDCFIARGVAKTVIDDLEAIQIRNDESQRQSLLAGLAQGLLQPQTETPSVEQSGKRIGQGFGAQFFLQIDGDCSHDGHGKDQQEEGNRKGEGDPVKGLKKARVRDIRAIIHDRQRGAHEEMDAPCRKEPDHEEVERLLAFDLPEFEGQDQHQQAATEIQDVDAADDARINEEEPAIAQNGANSDQQKRSKRWPDAVAPECPGNRKGGPDDQEAVREQAKRHELRFDADELEAEADRHGSETAAKNRDITALGVIAPEHEQCRSQDRADCGIDERDEDAASQTLAALVA